MFYGSGFNVMYGLFSHTICQHCGFRVTRWDDGNVEWGAHEEVWGGTRKTDEKVSAGQ